jgi:hypothetical protein
MKIIKAKINNISFDTGFKRGMSWIREKAEICVK